MNTEKALEFASSLVGTPYGWWTEGQTLWGGLAPFWVANVPPPSPEIIKCRSTNCTGLINLIYRYIDKPIPGTERGEEYDFPGGTWIWFHTLEERRALQDFDPNKLYPKGTLLLRDYTSEYDQGHVAVIYEACGTSVLESRLIHSYPDEINPVAGIQVSPGVTIDAQVADSHCNWMGGNYYTHVCLPDSWLD